MLETFHFLRPEWFIAIPFIAVLLFLRVKHSRKNSGWEDVCDPELLQYQLAQQADPMSASSFRLLNWTVPIIFFVGIISLAGPSWEKKEQPVFQQGNALVIILDLSLSMNATDIKPSRIERAKLKLTDILKTKKEGQTALIAFAGDAHTVSPLTIDSKTIISLLPALNSGIMPLSGSHLLDALSTAKQLFQNAGFAQGDVLLLSDGVDSSQQDALKKHIKKLRQQGYRFSVIGIGSQAGSPIPMPAQGGFIKDQSGQVVLSKLAPEPLEKLARIGGGTYYKLSLDDSDFQAILKQKMDQNNNLIDQDKQLEQWIDSGAYFTLLLIPLALLSFRKGLFSLVLCLSFASSFFTEPSYAEEQNNKQWQQLWSTADQQGQKSFNAKDYQAAADKFSNQQWKASSYYRSGDYEKALEQYTQSDVAGDLYNKGNTLAHLNKFQDAINAYKEVLKKGAELDATIIKNTRQNLDYVKELLAQQKKQSSDNNSDKKSDKNSDEKNNNSEKTSEDQDQEQQKSSDDASKSNDSNSDESEQNKSEDSNSEGADTEGEDSGTKGEDSPESDNSPEPEDTSDSKSPTQAKENESQSPEEAKTPDKAKPIQDQEKKPEGESQQASQAESSEDESQENTDGTQNDVLSQLSQEEQQSMKQWLQRIPDNPGELLRIKFRNNTLLKQRQADSSDIQYEGNPW